MKPEDLLAQQLKAEGLPAPILEYRFAPPRRWRFDLAWPQRRLACEIEGGIWVRGRHTRGSGYKGDLEKYNAAALAGWMVLRYTPDDVKYGFALDGIRAALAVAVGDGKE